MSIYTTFRWFKSEEGPFGSTPAWVCTSMYNLSNNLQLPLYELPKQKQKELGELNGLFFSQRKENLLFLLARINAELDYQKESTNDRATWISYVFARFFAGEGYYSTRSSIKNFLNDEESTQQAQVRAGALTMACYGKYEAMQRLPEYEIGIDKYAEVKSKFSSLQIKDIDKQACFGLHSLWFHGAFLSTEYERFIEIYTNGKAAANTLHLINQVRNEIR
jgi:hypothetical protein